jgi:7,8-dihydro-6-hydroxymethylpterin dimethyltransferase
LADPYRQTTGLCSRCKRAVPAEVVRVGDEVLLRKRCDTHGEEDAQLSSSAAWYERTLAAAPVLQRPEAKRPVALGCPFDCGPCESHEQRLHLPIVPITSSCNLDCPICYTHNKNEGAWHMSEGELRAILEHLRRAAPEKRIINLTGGEPTLHPQFERIVEMCREEGIHRITISTHGLRLAKDEALVEKLARLRARVILSFDSLDEDVNRRMLGGAFGAQKQRAIDLLEKHDVDVTLLPVIARGENDGELGAFVDLTLSRPGIRSLELHTMTFTGQGGASYDRRARYGPYEVLCDLERQTGGVLRVDDFVPSPAAHPLCYQVTYLLRLEDGRWLPFPRFMEGETLRDMLAGGLYLEPGPQMEARLEEVIDRLWAGDIVCDDAEAVLRTLRRIIDDVFAPHLDEDARMRVAERSTKAIYVHAHMDEETFDTDRIRQCCVGIREPDGTNIPSCAYNVLYRERDARFMERPAEPLVQLGLRR